MKSTKKLASVILALILCLSTFCSVLPAYADQFRYLDENNNFVRLHNDEYITYLTSWDEAVEIIKQDFKMHYSNISIDFAVPDSSKYFFKYDYPLDDTSTQEEKDAYAIQEQERENKCLDLATDMFYAAFEYDKNDPFAGDYLYNSIILTSLGAEEAFSYTYLALPNENDIIDGVQYANVHIEYSNIKYYTTLEQDQIISETIKTFNDLYINPNDSAYKKVKIIYDFIVRHVLYDELTFKTNVNEIGQSGKASMQRYLNSHSAIGALFGTNDYSSIDVREFFKTKKTSIDELVVEKYDQATAVCEGYSKLFYLLCITNGIDCRIVGGDYSNDVDHLKDAHEWNMVKLNNTWYNIDTTFAASNSLKIIDFNNYDYFLRGTTNKYWSKEKHQVAYNYTNNHLGDDKDSRHQLEDWYTPEFTPSAQDYDYEEPSFQEVASRDTPFLVIREYTFNDEERGSYLLTSTDGKDITIERIEINGNVITKIPDVQGFTYSGIESDFTVGVPYIVNGMVKLDHNTTKNWKNAGDYNVELIIDRTSIKVPFSIVPLNMEGSEDNYKKIKIDNQASYYGTVITPKAEIIDGYNNTLVENRDYKINIYKDKESKEPVELKEIGTYYIEVEYINNYSGFFGIPFSIDQIKFSLMSIANQEYTYIPRKIDKTNSAYEFIQKHFNLKPIGSIDFQKGKDYGISVTPTQGNGRDFNTSGIVTVNGVDGINVSNAPEDAQTFSYTISKKYDISSLNETYADTSQFAYTGSEVKPTSFANLEAILDKDVDYQIVGYENNIEPSTQDKPAYVILKAIGGCKTDTETFKMKFVIVDKRTSLLDIKFEYEFKNNIFTYSLIHNGKKLVKDVDYTESFNPDLVIKGIGNYKGTINIDGAKNENVHPTKHIHSITSGLITKKPTCISGGNIDYYCYCGDYVNSETTSPTGTHTYSTLTVSPSYYANGYTLYTCVDCGTSYKDKITKKKTLAKPSITLKGAKKSFKVSYKKITGASGYQIQYGTKKNFKGAKSIKQKATSKSISKLKKGTYYVRVRAYRTEKGKKTIYTSWVTKTVKVK